MLSYVERGHGAALVLLHAFPLDHTMWQPQIEALSPRYRVITPDTFGFGGSVPARPWKMDDMVEAVEDLLDALEIDQCHLVGLSMGGYIALNYAAKYRNRVSKFVLAHSRARADTDAERQKRNDMIAALEQEGISMLPKAMLGRLLRPDPPPDVADRVRRKILGADAKAAAYAVAAMRDRPDCRAVLPTITFPALVLAGEADAVFPVDECRQVAADLPNARFSVIHGAGHLSNLENPNDFNKAVSEFLDA